ncbi:tRNA pseudouridine(13) synthase TruD [Mergibacter septicus]|uniref:tRNA pseudouridine(13) synthase TruD n=1 Tax=Mergibacter septicus TaxID=221402 RepID=UPI0011794D3F|nr:tRNA pseudouridine(13) synthase TruD [Mergibacter septicus]AWX13995.1 tRNA pseudouridine(13) synthase TruD [Mergibacter septicus]
MLEQLAYLQGKPSQTARLKAQFSDFIVREELGYPFNGEGEFVVVKVRKTDCNTLFVAEKLAQFAGIPAKSVSYAGLKDRHAITEQWFCLHLPRQETPDFSQFNLNGIEILAITRHQRKIRIGSLKGNWFSLLLRDLSTTPELVQRLETLKIYGFPNYFGEQRFGHNGNNLAQAYRWAKGEIKIKDRKKRSFYLSAARSEVFNQLLSARLEQGLIRQVLPNDILQLQGSQSWFIADKTQNNLVELQQRLEQQDLNITAPLIGDDAPQCLPEYEQHLVMPYADLLKLMQFERVKSARRAALCLPQQLDWQFTSDGLNLQFFLPTGSYATALVREIALIV